jgi:hypothetical protein
VRGRREGNVEASIKFGIRLPNKIGNVELLVNEETPKYDVWISFLGDPE